MAVETTYGRIEEFRPDIETFSAYTERVQLFLEANAVPEERRVAVVLNVVGTKNYSLLRDMVPLPDKPSGKSVMELLALLKDHYEPQPVTISERYHFYSRSQSEDESVSQFVAELRRLAATCSFGEHLNEALRDRLVCGIKSAGARKKLLAERDLTFQRAVEIATNYEAIDKNSKSMEQSESSEPSTNVHVMKSTQPAGLQNQRHVSSSSSVKDRRPCYRCGKEGHGPNFCRFKNARCNNCAKLGHIAAVCKAPRMTFKMRRERSQNRAQWLETAEGDESDADDDMGLFRIHAINSRTPPIVVAVKINGKVIEMEVDTGAAVTILSEAVKKKHFNALPLKPSSIQLQTYTAENIKVLGTCQVKVNYGTQDKELEAIVVEGSGPCLFGRNWLQHIKLDWGQIASVVTTQDKELQRLLKRYKNVFDEKTGTMRNIQAKLQLKEGAIPKYHRPRPVPFAIKEAVGQELDRLEASGILERVKTSNWAAPIVAVPKKDGKIRLCGDYKVTINPFLEVDVHPLPRADELFAEMAGGQKFTRLDLTNAYQQMELEEESRKLVTITTHQGLYRYTRLPFGVSSAPALFQQTMDNILQGLDKVVCFIDDILITGKDDADHFAKLEEVLKRLDKNGITIKQAKCKFLRKSVEFLGHCIDSQGVHAMPDKLSAIVNAPKPKNLHELRSFLGLLNYYNRFIPNLASVLNPLNNLLKQKVKWCWSNECTQAMEEAKRRLLSSNVLVHFDPKLSLKLDTDASAYGVGAVLSHVFEDGKERPIAFASRTLSAAERNYSQLEKEALSIIFGVKKFHQYLYGHPFVLVTDHKPLTTILGPNTGIPTLAAARLQRWALLLSAYSYSIEYRKTDLHANADGLSRLPVQEAGQKSELDVDSLFNIVQMSGLPLNHAKLKSATQSDSVLHKVLEFTRKGWPGKVDDDLTTFSKIRNELTVEADCVLRGSRVIIPSKYRKQVLQELHSSHPGMCRMKSQARSHVWWPGIDSDIEQLVKSCQFCVEVKSTSVPTTLHPWIWPSKPWKRLHIDFAGPLFGKTYLIVIDACSKWPEVWEMPSTLASKTVAVLRHLFSLYGIPDQVVTDNGPQFVAQEFSAFLKSMGVKHFRSAPYHPATNGAVERFVKTFKLAMKIGKKEGKTSPQEVLENFLFQYRATPHAATDVSPAELFLGRPLKTKLDLLKPDLSGSVCASQARQKFYHDTRGNPKDRVFSSGQKVLARDYRHGNARWIKGCIKEVLGPLTYLVSLADGCIVKRHIEQLKLDTILDQATEDFTWNTSNDMPAGTTGETSDTPVPTDSESDTAEEIVGGGNNDLPTHSPTPPRYPTRERQPPDRPFCVSF